MSIHTLNTTYTMAELAKRNFPGGEEEKIAEVLDKKLPILKVFPWFPSNQITSHKMKQRGSLPSGEWRKINGYTGTSQSSVEMVEEGIGLLEDFTFMDEELYDLAENGDSERSDEDIAHVEGNSQKLEDQIINGDMLDSPEKFAGLLPRYNSLANENVIDNAGGVASATANKTSVWVVQLGRRAVHLIYPKNTKTGGIQRINNGRVSKVDPNDANKKAYGYESQFKFRTGLAIHNVKCVKRVCNISTSNINETDDFTFDPEFLIAAINAIPDKSQAVILCNETIMTMLDIALFNKSNVHLTVENWNDVDVTHFKRVPILQADMISNTEATVV